MSRMNTILLFACIAQAHAEAPAATHTADAQDSLDNYFDKFFQTDSKKDSEDSSHQQDSEETNLVDKLFSKMLEAHSETGEAQDSKDSNADAMNKLYEQLFQGHLALHQANSTEDSLGDLSNLVDKLFQTHSEMYDDKNQTFDVMGGLNDMVNKLFQDHATELEELKKANPNATEDETMDKLIDGMSDKLIDRAVNAFSLPGLDGAFPDPSSLSQSVDDTTLGKTGNVDVPFPNPAASGSPLFNNEAVAQEAEAAILAVTELADAFVAAMGGQDVAADGYSSGFDADNLGQQFDKEPVDMDLAEEPEDSEETSSDSFDFTVPIAGLMAFFVGSGITFAALRVRPREKKSDYYQSLM